MDNLGVALFLETPISNLRELFFLQDFSPLGDEVFLPDRWSRSNRPKISIDFPKIYTSDLETQGMYFLILDTQGIFPYIFPVTCLCFPVILDRVLRSQTQISMVTKPLFVSGTDPANGQALNFGGLHLL